jgi:drug/metabolite transporter (DMT)-like permease
VLLVVGLGLTAAFFFALAASLQQHEANEANRRIRHQQHQAELRQSSEDATDRRPTFILALARQLARSQLWRLGWAINLAGFLAQAAALYLGSVALVQPLLVTQLIFALPLTTWWDRRWPSRRDWLSGAAISCGITLFLVSHGSSALQGEADRDRIVLAGVSAAAAIALLVRISAKRSPLVQAALLSVGAGLSFAYSAVLMKLTAEDLIERGVGATAVDWPGYTLAVSALTGVVLGQWAFATGSLPTAVATMTITNPVASYVIGILGFRVAPEASPPRLAATGAAAALIIVGVVGLARSSIVKPRTGAPAVIGDPSYGQDG